MNNKFQKRLHKHFKINILLATFIIFSLTTFTAISGSTTSVLNVSVSVGIPATCTAILGALNFGTFTGTTLTTSTTFNIDCGGTPTAYTVDFDGGQSGDPSNRSMIGTNFSTTLPYQIFQDAALTIPLDGTNQITGTGNAFGGAIFANMPSTLVLPPADNFTDNVNVTVTF